MLAIAGLATGAAGLGASVFGGSGFFGASEAAGFSAFAGLASSSAMIRRIDARISSIEGSWAFAGCVISDSTSSTPSPAFYTYRDSIAGPDCTPEPSSRRTESPNRVPLIESPGFGHPQREPGQQRSSQGQSSQRQSSIVSFRRRSRHESLCY